MIEIFHLFITLILHPGAVTYGARLGAYLPPPPHTQKNIFPHPPTHTHFCVAARKREAKKKRKGVSNQKPLKGCHQVKMLLFIHSRASRIQTF